MMQCRKNKVHLGIIRPRRDQEQGEQFSQIWRMPVAPQRWARSCGVLPSCIPVSDTLFLAVRALGPARFRMKAKSSQFLFLAAMWRRLLPWRSFAWANYRSIMISISASKKRLFYTAKITSRRDLRPSSPSTFVSFSQRAVAVLPLEIGLKTPSPAKALLWSCLFKVFLGIFLPVQAEQSFSQSSRLYLGLTRWEELLLRLFCRQLLACSISSFSSFSSKLSSQTVLFNFMGEGWGLDFGGGPAIKDSILDLVSLCLERDCSAMILGSTRWPGLLKHYRSSLRLNSSMDASISCRSPRLVSWRSFSVVALRACTERKSLVLRESIWKSLVDLRVERQSESAFSSCSYSRRCCDGAFRDQQCFRASLSMMRLLVTLSTKRKESQLTEGQCFTCFIEPD